MASAPPQVRRRALAMSVRQRLLDLDRHGLDNVGWADLQRDIHARDDMAEDRIALIEQLRVVAGADEELRAIRVCGTGVRHRYITCGIGSNHLFILEGIAGNCAGISAILRHRATLNQAQRRSATQRAGQAGGFDTPEVGVVVIMLLREKDEVVGGDWCILGVELNDDVPLRRLDSGDIGLARVDRHDRRLVTDVRLEVAGRLWDWRWRERANLILVEIKDRQANHEDE